MRSPPRIGLMAVIGLIIAGCDTLPDGRGIRTLSVLESAVSVRGPDGFCIDQQSSRATSGFAVLVGCAVVSDANIMPAREALITVQIGAAGSAAVTGAEPEFVALLRSGQGAALLSATGSSATVRIDRVDRAEGVVVVRFSDQAPPAIAGLEPVEWRAFLDIDGRLTTISLRGFARAPLPADDGLRLLSQAVGALRLANAPASAEVN